MKKRDLIFVLTVLIITIILFLIFQIIKKPGEYVKVMINGEVVASYSLDIDNDYILNDGTNILRISSGKAQIIDANCPDHLCVKHRSICNDGETIVCLPNKLTVTVYSDNEYLDLEN